MYIGSFASDTERFYGRLRNKVIPVAGDLTHNGVLLNLKIPVHNRLGIQFKLFVQTESRDTAETLKKILESNRIVSEASVSERERRYRVYFLASKFVGETKSIEGIRNNLVLPE